MWFGRAGHAEAKAVGYAFLVTGRSFLQNALGEGLGGFDEGNVVERDEGGKVARLVRILTLSPREPRP